MRLFGNGAKMKGFSRWSVRVVTALFLCVAGLAVIALLAARFSTPPGVPRDAGGEARRLLSDFPEMAPGDAFEQSVVACAATSLLERGEARMACDLARQELFGGPLLTPEPFAGPADRRFRALLRERTEAGRWNMAAGLMLSRADALPEVVDALFSENGSAISPARRSLSVTNATFDEAVAHVWNAFEEAPHPPVMAAFLRREDDGARAAFDASGKTFEEMLDAVASAFSLSLERRRGKGFVFVRGNESGPSGDAGAASVGDVSPGRTPESDAAVPSPPRVHPLALKASLPRGALFPAVGMPVTLADLPPLPEPPSSSTTRRRAILPLSFSYCKYSNKKKG